MKEYNSDFQPVRISNEIGQLPPYHNARPFDQFVQEWYRRDSDVTNSTDRDYEYTQPQTLIFRATSGTTTASFQVQNPFDTPAQFCVIFCSIKEQNDCVYFTFDQPPPLAYTPPTAQQNPNFQPGLIFNDNVQPVPALYWVDFQNYVGCFMNVGTIGANVIIAFRRKRDQVIPRNFTPFNEPSQ